MSTPMLTVCPKPRGPSILEPAIVFDASNGRRFDVTLEDGTVIFISVDCGTLLIRSNDTTFKVVSGARTPDPGGYVRLSKATS